MKIRTLGDDVLRKKAKSITKFDESLKQLVDDMFATLEKANGIGLAAPQVGISKTLFVISIKEQGVERVFVNPQITETSVETGEYEEGCLSIPGQFFNVIRPLKVSITAQDVHGKIFSLHADGLFARAIFHEYDHLEGKLFIDRLSEENRAKVVKRYEKSKRKHKQSNT